MVPAANGEWVRYEDIRHLLVPEPALCQCGAAPPPPGMRCAMCGVRYRGAEAFADKPCEPGVLTYCDCPVGKCLGGPTDRCVYQFAQKKPHPWEPGEQAEKGNLPEFPPSLPDGDVERIGAVLKPVLDALPTIPRNKWHRFSFDVIVRNDDTMDVYHMRLAQL